ncbi:MAG TPA: double-strand break repair protein AddB [Xanthobacteraceae bacterium]|nr:double-strand break repair protein AddB [Xanthobacteraceae bacterium]
MADSALRLYTIPASAPFLPTLAEALLDGKLVPGYAPRNDPLKLTDAVVYLPTRRAARAFGFALLDALGAEAALLPRILPLGDIDEEALAFSEAAEAEEPLAAIDPVRRRLVLAKLVLQWTRQLRLAAGSIDPLIATTPAAAISLADQLAQLFDDMELAGVPFEAIGKAVPQELDQYWEVSRQFLEIAQRGWSAYLQEQKLLDPAVRRDKLLAREAERLAKSHGPVIAAGSTGSLPAVANILRVIARHREGAVVLPGLDLVLDDESFDAIEAKATGGKDLEGSPGHPQFGLKRLLAHVGATRADVMPLAAAREPARERILSEAFRPAITTDRWKPRARATADDAEGIAGLIFVEATEPREEALAIALALRETLETEGGTAALVTPDRALARRVAAELTRWNIAADDSAGIPLSETEAGRFARLAATVAAEALAPIPLLAFLRHPLSRFTHEAIAIDALEQAALRGPRPAPGAESLARAVSEQRRAGFHPRDPRAKLREEDWTAAAGLAEGVGAALAPLTALAGKPVSFAILLDAHQAVLARAGLDLAATEREDAKTLAEAFDRLHSAAADAFDLSLADYANAFGELIADPPVRPALDPAARIRILGPLEARLLSVDRVIVGGLNEGSWPPEPRTDAFINRPMRRRLGLDLPERRIGLSAHDLAQLMGTREVILTRARRHSGVETVASRFLQRLEAVAPEDAWKAAADRGARLRLLARALDRPAHSTPVPISRPEPRPPVAARPRRLSVTEIADLVRDPYTIYARHILRLAPLDEIDADPGAAERGTLLHQAFAEFARAYPETMPADGLQKLLALGRKAFEAYEDFPGTTAVWWSRFARAASWFINEEAERRKAIKKTLAEINGKIEFPVGGEAFTLSARADRIDLFADGSIGVLDYKTGAAPGVREMRVGLAPQLPLEAAIARAGGFKGVAKGASVAEIAVIRLSGGDPPGEIKQYGPDDGAKNSGKGNPFKNCDELADFNLTRLKNLLTAFASEEQPYHPIPRPKWRLRYGEYDHLARIAEWSAFAGGEE